MSHPRPRNTKFQRIGNKRRRFLWPFMKLLGLPPDQPPTSPNANEASIIARLPARHDISESTQPNLENTAPVSSTFPLPFHSLEVADLDPLEGRLDSITRNPDDNRIHSIIVYGGGRHVSGHDDTDLVSKVCLAAFFDGGADVNLVEVHTLERLQKGYIKAEDMPKAQQDRLKILQVHGHFEAIGSVTLEFYFDDVPGVCFHMPCYVTNGPSNQDILIGESYIKAIYAAIAQARKRYGDGLRWPHLKVPRPHIARLRFAKRHPSLVSVRLPHCSSPSQSSLLKSG